METLTLLIGTTKGAFLIDATPGRSTWSLRGPFCDGWPINHVIGDPATGTIWAAGGGGWYGIGVWRSDDQGATWAMSPLDPDAAGSGGLQSVWSLGLSGGTLHAGTKPAALYSSPDRGSTWQKVPALSDHPSGPDWHPGAAGLILHSIVTDPGHPGKLWVGISAAGVFATEDGGKTWDRRNRRSNHDTETDDTHAGGDVGLCVHNIVRAPADGDLMYQQNHHGAFRSQDGGRTWASISDGLPSRFGFPVAVHPRDPATLWLFPLNGDSAGRFPPDAAAVVWRSHTGGESWEPMRTGLPPRDCFFTVLRQAMATDRGTPAGVYFGTNSGSVFASADEGDTWAEIARHLPTVLSVETLQRG